MTDTTNTNDPSAISLLPAVNQTGPLTNFFGATVDQLFRRGSSEQISGYVGEQETTITTQIAVFQTNIGSPIVNVTLSVPANNGDTLNTIGSIFTVGGITISGSYVIQTNTISSQVTINCGMNASVEDSISENVQTISSNTDFYKQEPTAIRQAYQLVAGTVVRNLDTTVNSAIGYDDLINNLAANGALTNDPNRLFSDDFYAWAPPIDIDKLCNFQEYVWFGDSVNLIPTVKLHAPTMPPLPGTSVDPAYIGNDVETSFAMPPALTGALSSDESPMLFVGGFSVPFMRNGDNLVATVAPSLGEKVVVYRYGDLTKVLGGKTNFDITQLGSNGQGVAALESDMRVVLLDGNNNFFSEWDEVPFDEAPFDDSTSTINTYVVQGVGSAIHLVPSSSATTIETDLAQYVVIARGSVDGNPWSLKNHWYHMRSFSWSDQTFPSRRATRPILEYVRNIELSNYGTSRVPDIDGVISTPPLHDPLAEGLAAFKRDVTNLIPVATASLNGRPVNSAFADNGHLIQVGDRILVTDTSDPTIAGRILTIGLGSAMVNNQQSPAMVVTASDLPRKGAVVKLGAKGFLPYDTNEWDTVQWEYDNSEVEYCFNGTTWAISTIVDVMATDPLFAVYDDSGKRLANGNSIFSFQVPSIPTTNDPVLNRPVIYDAQGQIVFENFLVTESQTAGGYQFYHILPDAILPETYANGWYPSASRSTQTPIAQPSNSETIWGIPTNLSANPNNDEVTTISRSQWMEHMTSILQNQDGFRGSPYADNNWAETAKNLGLGTHIVQNRSPLLKTMYLLNNSTTDIIQAARFVEREYTRYKNSFVQKIQYVLRLGTLEVSDTPQAWCDELMAQLSIGKTAKSPFAANTVGGGTYYIPPTPAYLGMAPCRRPAIEIDSTYSPSLPFLIGHDCSRTPLMGDYRDAILMELETRIYKSISPLFQQDYAKPFDFYDFDSGRGRPVTASRYSVDEINVLLGPNFAKWSQDNGFDYRSNSNYVSGQPFTYNFAGVQDAYGATLRGSWRAIYRYYFDTDRPHSDPWEMLGFSEKPTWFDSTYGVGPYTNGNLKLWTDIASGTIASGFRKGVDSRFSRPNLLDHLPVDEGGNLLDPMACGIVPMAPSADQASADWKLGDLGPVENLWRNSSSYGFALSRVSYLMRPAQFIEMGWDTGNLRFLDRQWTNALTRRRPKGSDLQFHGETDSNGNVVQIIGVQQWISDYIVFNALSLTTFADFIRSLNVNLIHKMAGFTSSDIIKLYTDNFGLIPQEDYAVIFHQSQPVSNPVYSGVIIELTDGGWSVVGYDPMNEYFTIFPVDVRSRKSTISLGSSPTIYDWRPNTYYAVDSLAQYASVVYKSNASHTSGPTFEPSFWTMDASAVAIAPSAILYSGNLANAQIVPYATVLPTVQDVINFLAGHAAYQSSFGWSFEDVDENGLVIDWYAAMNQFMQWAQVRWQPGNFIALSPGASSLVLNSATGYTLAANNYANGNYNLVNRTGGPISNADVSVARLGSTTTYTVATQDLFFARTQVVEVENLLVFNNLTIFSDIIYAPLFSLRQPRIRMIGQRTQDWNGRYEAPGFVILNGVVFSNFDKDSEDVRMAFDIENSQDKTLRSYARHDIGYDDRSYLDKMLLSDTSQFEFYQGFIKAKGTVGAFDKIVRNSFAAQDNGMSFLEEWAFQIGAYGAVARTNTFSFGLVRTDMTANPQIIKFTDTDMSSESVFSVTKNDWVSNSTTNENIFPEAKAPAAGYDVGYTRSPQTIYDANALPTAGYVRFDEISYCVMTTTKLNDLYAYINRDGLTIDATTVIWVYSDHTGSWDVQKLYPMGATANPVIFIEMNYEDSTLLNKTRIVFQNPHGLDAGDVGATILIQGMSNTTPDIEGFHRLLAVESPASILIPVTGQTGINYEENAGDLAPTIYILRSHRFGTLVDFQTFKTKYVPAGTSYAYVDGASGWTVQQYQEDASGIFSWGNAPYRQQPPTIDSTQVSDVLIYSTQTKITSATSFTPEPLQFSGITVYDPINGMINSAAASDIHYKHEYDPARYNNNTEDCWGKSQIGQLWWDLSTVRYLVSQTDIITTANSPADDAELKYRAAWWGKAAPGSSFDVYEWTRSYDPPSQYAGIGTVYNPDGGTHWVEVSEFDTTYNKIMSVYYYWVSGLQTVPNYDDRKYSAYQVAYMLANPQDMVWFAPISTDTILVNGISPYLTDSDSVLQFDIVNNPQEGNIHKEWALVKVSDSVSEPPAMFYDALRRSIVGYDDFANSIPDMSLAPENRIGAAIRPRQSLFAFDGATPSTIRGSLIAGRTAFLTILNAMLTTVNMNERPDSLAMLDQSAPIFDLLFWSGSAPIIYPPLGTYDYTATSLNSRDAIFASADYLAKVAKGENPRVLLTNFNSPILSWGVWQMDPTANPLLSIEHRLVLAKNYDFSVGTRVGLQLLIESNVLSKGNRVLIQNDETNSGVWTVVTYDPSASGADQSGVVLSAIQTYRTRDFYEVGDWYATGYSAATPPSVTYKTVAIRDRLEPTPPNNAFVGISNGGSWSWTAYDPSTRQWKVVALKGATIQLSSRFLDAAAPVFGIGSSYNPSDFTKRDGSLELGIIFDTLRTSILESQEMNTIWFSLVKYIHSVQDQVDWAFKTSYLNIISNETLTQTPILGYDNTPNIINYINEVKPYRVKIRDFVEGYSTLDLALVNATDFDRPPTENGRILDNGNATDVAMMAAPKSAWATWYNNYAKTGTDPSNPSTYNPVRKMDITINFDRIDPGLTPLITPYGWDVAKWDSWPWDNVPPPYDPYSTALSRMIKYYTPTDTMIEKDAALLFGLGFKGLLVDGGQLFQSTPGSVMSGWDVDAFDTDNFDDNQIVTSIDIIMDGSDGTNIEVEYNSDASPRTLLDPLHDEGHPEELVYAHVNDGLFFLSESKWTAGAPKHFVTHVDTTDYPSGDVFLSYPEVAQKSEAVWVFRDGHHINAMPSQCEIDHFKRTVRVNITETDYRMREGYDLRLREIDRGYRLLEESGIIASNVTVHAFGVGGSLPILEQRYFDGDGARTSFAMLAVPQFVEVVIDGEVFFVSNAGLRLLEDDGGAQLTEDGADRGLEGSSGNYSVSVNGDTVIIAPAPPAGSDVMIISRTLNASNPNISTGIYVMSQALTGNALNTWPLAYPSSGTVPEHAAVILEDDEGIRLKPPSTVYATIGAGTTSIKIGAVSNSANVKVWIDGVLHSGAIPTAGTLAAAQALNPLPPMAVVGSTLHVLDATLVGYFAVSVYENHDYVVGNGIVAIVNSDFTPTDNFTVYTFQNAANMGIETWCFDGNANGTYVFEGTVKGTDYSLVTVDGLYLTGNVNYSFSTLGNFTTVTIPPQQTPNQKVILTLFKGYAALSPSTWYASSLKMGLEALGDPSMLPYNGVAPVQATAPTSKYGDVPLYKMNGAYEITRGSLGTTSYLASDLNADDTTIDLVLLPVEIASAFVPANPLPIPNGAKPGAVWIDGERIEYFSIVRDGNNFTLGELRRGSRRTRTGAEQNDVATSTGGSAFTFVGLNQNFEVSKNGQGLIQGTGYAVSTNGSDATVTVHDVAPTDFVVVRRHNGVYHPSGTWVRPSFETVDTASSPFLVGACAG